MPQATLPLVEAFPLRLVLPKTREQEAQITSVTAAAGAGPAAGSAMKLVLIQSSCTVAGSEPDIPPTFHPTGLVVGGSQEAGAIVANFSIMVGFAAFFKLAATILYFVCPGVLHKLDTADAEGFLRFPSAPLFVFQWFYQGTSVNGMILTMYHKSWWQLAFGLFTTLVCVAVPFLVLYKVRKGVPSEAMYRNDTELCGFMSRLLIGRGEWVSLRKERHWVQRYASVIRTYNQRCAHFAFFEFMSALALSALSTVRVASLPQCGAVKTAQAIVFFVMLLILALYWPHVRHRDNAVGVLFLGLQASAVSLMAVSFFKDDKEHPNIETASIVFSMATYLLMAQVLCDICTEVFVFVKKRRTRLQDMTWKEASEPSFSISPETTEGSRLSSSVHSYGRQAEPLLPGKSSITDDYALVSEAESSLVRQHSTVAASLRQPSTFEASLRQHSTVEASPATPTVALAPTLGTPTLLRAPSSLFKSFAPVGGPEHLVSPLLGGSIRRCEGSRSGAILPPSVTEGKTGHLPGAFAAL